MKLDVWQCDRCGKEYRDGQHHRLDVTTGTKRESDGEIADVVRTVDLCAKCMHLCAMSLMRKFVYDERGRFLEAFLKSSSVHDNTEHFE